MAYQISKIDKGCITSAKGFKAAGLSCGIKKSGRPDLALLVGDKRFQVAGTFTTNQVKGCSLKVSKANIANGSAQVVLVNSGNSNSCTGERGLADAQELTRFTAELLDTDADNVLPSSTGVIGEFLPMEKIKKGIENAVNSLSADNGVKMAEAILTTDRAAKYSARQITCNGESITLGGVVKGSGMVHPNMATMLAYITTDAAVDAGLLQSFLNNTNNQSFNRLTIDGDTSCCDTVLLMASGASGVKIEDNTSEWAEAFQEALIDLCTEFTYMMARDGEGVNHVVTIRVKGLSDPGHATLIAKTIAVSPLVKTAINGQDPNWGRIINAAGYSGVAFDLNKVDLWIEDMLVMKQGMRADYVEDEAHQIMQRGQYEITLDFNQGSHEDFYITTDFSSAYVDINADYRNRT